MTKPPPSKVEKKPTASELWNACADVLAKDGRPLEVWRVAKASGMTEDEVISTLIRATVERGKSVTFRYPPLPCAAITHLTNL